jgi:hypothetical protein
MIGLQTVLYQSNEKFPGIKNSRQAVSCTFQGPAGTFIYRGFGVDGFFLVDLKTKQVQRCNYRQYKQS